MKTINREVLEFIHEELELSVDREEARELVGNLQCEVDFFQGIDGQEYRFILDSEIWDIYVEGIKEITEDWGLQDYYIYEESTADGYSVYVATHDTNNICVNENIYYYDSDLKDALIDHIIDRSAINETIVFIDDINAYFVDEAIDELKQLMEERIEEAEND